MKKLLISALILSFIPFAAWSQEYSSDTPDYDSYSAIKKNKYAVESRPTNLKKYHTETGLITRSMKIMYPEQEQFLIQPAVVGEDGQHGYQTSFERNGHDYLSYFDEDGKWIETKVTCVDKNELPKGVKNRLSKMDIDENAVSSVTYYQTHKNQYYEIGTGGAQEEPEGTYYYDEDGVYYYYDEEKSDQSSERGDIVVTDIGRKLKKEKAEKKIRIG